jgi:hypothetical protein
LAESAGSESQVSNLSDRNLVSDGAKAVRELRRSRGDPFLAVFARFRPLKTSPKTTKTLITAQKHFEIGRVDDEPARRNLLSRPAADEANRGLPSPLGSTFRRGEDDRRQHSVSRPQTFGAWYQCRLV